MAIRLMMVLIFMLINGSFGQNWEEMRNKRQIGTLISYTSFFLIFQDVFLSIQKGCQTTGLDKKPVSGTRCEKFYLCIPDYGVPLTLSCPPGTLFDTITKNCNNKNVVLCSETSNTTVQPTPCKYSNMHLYAFIKNRYKVNLIKTFRI